MNTPNATARNQHRSETCVLVAHPHLTVSQNMNNNPQFKSKLIYFNALTERTNGHGGLEQQSKRKISTPTDSCLNVIGPVSGTTTPKHMFTYGRLSSSSTSSVASCTLSAINSGELTQTQHMTINPFEETNRFRLEQSVLSPNLFHVANTSTPEVCLRLYLHP